MRTARQQEIAVMGVPSSGVGLQLCRGALVAVLVAMGVGVVQAMPPMFAPGMVMPQDHNKHAMVKVRVPTSELVKIPGLPPWMTWLAMDHVNEGHQGIHEEPVHKEDHAHHDAAATPTHNIHENHTNIKDMATYQDPDDRDLALQISIQRHLRADYDHCHEHYQHAVKPKMAVKLCMAKKIECHVYRRKHCQLGHRAVFMRAAYVLCSPLCGFSNDMRDCLVSHVLDRLPSKKRFAVEGAFSDASSSDARDRTATDATNGWADFRHHAERNGWLGGLRADNLALLDLEYESFNQTECLKGADWPKMRKCIAWPGPASPAGKAFCDAAEDEQDADSHKDHKSIMMPMRKVSVKIETKHDDAAQSQAAVEEDSQAAAKDQPTEAAKKIEPLVMDDHQVDYFLPGNQ